MCRFRLAELETQDLAFQMDHRLHMVDMSRQERPQEEAFACRESCAGDGQIVFPDGTLLSSWPFSMKHTWMLLTQTHLQKAVSGDLERIPLWRILQSSACLDRLLGKSLQKLLLS